MTPIETLDVRALAGSLLFAVVALGAGLADRNTGVASVPTTGSVAGSVAGASRYRVFLTPLRSSGGSAPDQMIEGWGRGFRGDGLASGRYRLSVILDPDGDDPSLVVLLPLPIDAVAITPGSSDAARLEQFAAQLGGASSSGIADDIAPFFDEQFRGPSGQSRAEHLDQAHASAAAAETMHFGVAVKSGFRAGERWFAELSYQASYRIRGSGEVRNAKGLFLSELRDDGARLRFVSTESIPLPALSGIEALSKQFIAAPDLTMVVVRGGATTVLPRPIDVTATDRATLGPLR